jgi:hypothetical protein
MATHSDTTILPSAGTPSVPMVIAFRRFAASLPALISDEANLAGYSGEGPALDASFRAAERSRDKTLSHLNAVVAAKPRSWHETRATLPAAA